MHPATFRANTFLEPFVGARTCFLAGSTGLAASMLPPDTDTPVKAFRSEQAGAGARGAFFRGGEAEIG